MQTNTSNAESAPPVSAATLPAGAQVSPEIRRVLASIRIIIAVVAMLESLALDLLAQPAMGFMVMGYALYAAWLALRAAQGEQPAESPLTPWTDALWLLLLAWLAATPSSLFTLLLLFPVLFASLGFGFGCGLLVSLFAAGGALLVAYNHLGSGGMSLQAVLIPLSILVLGPLVAALARPGVQMKEQVAIAEHLLERADPRLGVERVVRVILETLQRHFAADLAMLLIWLPGCEPRLFRLDRASGLAEVHGDQLSTLLEAHAGLPRNVASVRHLARLPGGDTFPRHSAYDVTRRLPTREARGAMDALAERLDAHSLVAVPLCRRSAHPCWLVLDSQARCYRLRDVGLLVRILEQLAPVIENAALLEQLCNEAMATERVRIGRDLHDTAIQPYLGIKYGIEALARKGRPDNPLHEDILALRDVTASELKQLREVVSSMRSGGVRGDGALALALRRQARRFSDLFGIKVVVHCDADVPLSRRLSATVLHLVSEALTNIRRHTRARCAEIRLEAEAEQFILKISNDHGIESAPQSPFVPRSITERAQSLGGRVAVQLKRAGFTDLIITIPRVDEE